MLNVISNAALTTKVYGKLSKLLTPDDYENLMSLKSVSEAAGYLKQTLAYSRTLRDINENYIHRGQLEELLSGSLTEDCIVFLNYMGIGKKHMIVLFKLKNEIENIKLYLRLIESGHTERFKFSLNDKFEKYQTVNFNSVIGTKTFEQFVEALSGTVYHSLLYGFLGKDEHDLFNIEMALDMYYNKFALKTIKKYLTGSDIKAVTGTFGTETDLKNIAFILRAKKYYNLSPDRIYPYIVPNYFRLTRQDVKDMAESETYDGAMEVADQTAYKDAFGMDNRFLEKSIAEFSVSAHRKMFKKNPYSVAAPLMYIHMKDIEVRNLVAIIEGIRYGLDKNEIREHIIL